MSVTGVVVCTVCSFVCVFVFVCVSKERRNLYDISVGAKVKVWERGSFGAKF